MFVLKTLFYQLSNYPAYIIIQKCYSCSGIPEMWCTKMTSTVWDMSTPLPVLAICQLLMWPGWDWELQGKRARYTVFPQYIFFTENERKPEETPAVKREKGLCFPCILCTKMKSKEIVYLYQIA